MLRMRHDTSGERDRVRMRHDTSGERDRVHTLMMHSTSGRPSYSDDVRMLHPTSGRPLYNSVGVVPGQRNDFVRVTCDNCRQDINRTRYKCSCCPNFDFCDRCMNEYEQELMDSKSNPSASLRQRSAHLLNHHIFQRITFRVTTSSAPAFQNRDSWRHSGVKCSNCPPTADDIVGYRYFCTNCAVSLCESCELSGVHRLDHNLLKMVPSHIANDPQWQQGSGNFSTRK